MFEKFSFALESVQVVEVGHQNERYRVEVLKNRRAEGPNYRGRVSRRDVHDAQIPVQVWREEGTTNGESTAEECLKAALALLR